MLEVAGDDSAGAELFWVVVVVQASSVTWMLMFSWAWRLHVSAGISMMVCSSGVGGGTTSTGDGAGGGVMPGSLMS